MPFLYLLLQMLMPMIPIIIIIGIAVVIQKKKKKREEEREQERKKEREQERKKEREQEKALDFLSQEAQKIKDVNFPAFYFEKLYLGWLNTGENIEEQIATTKNNFKTMMDSFDNFLNALEILEAARYTCSLFLDSQQEMDAYVGTQTSDELEERISKEIQLMLPILASVKSQYSNYSFVIEVYFKKISPYEAELFSGLAFNKDESEYNKKCYDKAFKMAIKTYEVATQIKWQGICKSYPNLNNEYYHDKFIEFATKTDAFLGWTEVYIQRFLKVKNDLGITAWRKKTKALLKKMPEMQVHKFITKGFGEFSSIHEITDFSSAEISRIVDLYKSNQMCGVYSKAKDPKYN